MSPNHKRGKAVLKKKGLFSASPQYAGHSSPPSHATTASNPHSADASDVHIQSVSSSGEDEVMHDYVAGVNVLESEDLGSDGGLFTSEHHGSGSSAIDLNVEDMDYAHSEVHNDGLAGSQMHMSDEDVGDEVRFAAQVHDSDLHDDFSEDEEDDSEGEDEDEDDIDDEDDDGEDDDEDDDDDDDEDDVADDFYSFMSGNRQESNFLRELVERNRGSGGSASQSSILDVMSRLVDGLEGPGFGRQHSEFDALVSNISQRDDTYLILESINELSEKLLMMDGMTAERVIQPSELAKALVDILSDPILVEDLELHLVTCRCLYNFIEVNTDFIHDALNCKAVETLVAKLLDIVYIDLTEQCLQTLEIMSREKGSHSLILASDGLRGCLQNLDFLTVHSQRKCLQIVANACEDTSTVYFDSVLDQFQNLINVAKHNDDSAVKKSAWLAVSRVIDSFKDKPDLLEKLILDSELLRYMLNVILDSCNPSSTDVGLDYPSMISLLKSVIILISTSVKISNLFLGLDIGNYIKESLNKYKKSEEAKSRDHPTDEVSIESLISCPKELLSLFLTLIAYLSPITYSPKDTPFLPDDEQISQSKTRINYERNLLYRNDAAVSFKILTIQVWPVLIGSFQASMDFAIRKQALVCISRIVSFSDSGSMGKKESDSLYSILTSVISGGKKLVSSAIESDSKKDSSLKGPLLLLSSTCVTIKNLLLKSQLSCVPVLEKEGIFSDLAEITQNLSAFNSVLDDASTRDEPAIGTRRNRPSLANVYQEKFADRELLDFSSKMETRSIMTYLQITTVAISHHYADFSKLGDKFVTEMNRVAPIVNALSNAIENSSTSAKDWIQVWLGLASALSPGERGISSFELTSSGLLDLLMKVFQGSSLHSKSRKVATKNFIDVFYGENNGMRFLIAILQDSLARAESLEVISSGVVNPSGAENGSASLAKQIKIRLTCDDEGDPVKGTQFILSVHAIATFKAIEKFLKQSRFFHGVTEELEPLDEDVLDGSKNTTESAFMINGSRVSTDSTVFGAIFKSLRSKSSSKKIDAFDIWTQPHDVHYKLRAKKEDDTGLDEGQIIEPMDARVEALMELLLTLHDINKSVSKSPTFTAIPTEAFTNWKLTVKLNRQLEEPLIVASGSMPSWSIATTNKFSFVYPLSTRMFFLQSTSFGHSRLIHNWNNRSLKNATGNNSDSSSATKSSLSLGAPMRKKVRLARDKIFKGAIKVLQHYGSSPAILEIEYYDEVGSGLGPTLEFYASVSKAFCKKKLQMWRGSEGDGEYAGGPQGLFPSPMGSDENSQSEKNVNFFFRMLGVFIARALLDSRIVDFNFSTLFISLVQNPQCLDKMFSENDDVSELIDVLQDVDPDYARSLKYLSRFLPGSNESATDENVEIEGVKLCDLSLFFTVPGHEDLDLIDNGATIAVTSLNLGSYIEEVIKFLVGRGVRKQVESFRQGFTSVFPIESLSIFAPNELKEIFGSGEEDWSRETIAGSIKANHGFSQDSEAIGMLVNVLQGLNISERREFLQFLTGSPRLPIGGFKAMRPEFTVVRKHPDSGLCGDDYLPSVMTCANYLKLPSYTSEELLRSKLLHAIREGAGAFHLS